MSLIKPARSIQINRSEPLSRGLIGCWLLNENTGNRAFDESGHGNNGSINTYTQWQPGGFGSCLFFDGQDSRVDCESTDLLDDLPRFTVVCRAKCVGLGDNYKQYMVAKRSEARWALRINYETSYYELQANVCHATQDALSISEHIDISLADKWHQYVMRFDGSVIDLFIDGREIPQYDSHLAAEGSRVSDVGESLYFGNSVYSNRSWYGQIDHLLLFGRPLTAEEIFHLYIEPFVIFEQPVSRGLLYADSGETILISGTCACESSLSGTLSVTRNVSGSIECSTELSGSLQNEMAVGGIITASSTLTGSLTFCSGAAGLGILDIELTWLREALLNGITAQAMAFSTALISGWFWMRAAGCSVLYRGQDSKQIETDNPLAVNHYNCDSICPPDYLTHQANHNYYYLLRRFNGLGYQEKSLTAIAKVSIDADGNLTKLAPNKIFALAAQQISTNKVQLSWFYNPIEQQSEPVCFRIYSDNGSGQVDFNNPIGTVTYQRQIYYSFTCGNLSLGRYTFVVKAEGTCGTQDKSTALLQIELIETEPEPINILNIQTI